ncbi:MAG TPA: hypothetical protein VN493_06280 [Thermoanaerobaculia bacterium]|nr:hypothetical protein [Thermoanaerobaculia bacterium]
MKNLGVSIVALVALALPAAAGLGAWTPLGPDGGTVYTLAVDPGDPDTVFAGTQSGMFRSTDGGETWSWAGRGLKPEGVDVRSILVTAGAIYIGTDDDGIFKSTDGGQSWVPASNGIPGVRPGFGPNVGALTIDPRNPNRIWAGTHRGLFSTTNGGANWTTRFQGDPFDNPIQGIAIDPANGQIYISSHSRGVYTSTDQGKKWVKVSKGLLGASYFDLLLDPQNPSVLYVGTGLGVWKSTNRGGQWTKAGFNESPSSSLPVRALAWQGDRLFAGVLSRGVFYSDDRGRTWNPAPENPEDLDILEVAAGPGAVYAGTFGDRNPGGVFRSLDRGLTWEPARKGLQSLAVDAVAVDPTDPDVLYAAANLAGLFKSTDRGASWQPLNLGLPLNANPRISTLLVAPTDPATVYAGSGYGTGGLFASEDGGETWRQVLSNFNAEDLEQDSRPGDVWAGGFPGLYHNGDGGDPWVRFPVPGGDNVWIRAMEQDPTDPDVLWAAGGVFVKRPSGFSRLELRVFRSTDRGQTWQRRDKGINAPFGFSVIDLALDPADPDTLYAGTDLGLYRTRDAGLTWTAVPGFSGPVSEVETAPTQPTAVYAFRPGFGVLRSRDQGATWVAVRRWLTSTPLLDLLVDPTDPRRLYAGTLTRGLFTYTEPAN